jgi:hypothetical protein
MTNETALSKQNSLGKQEDPSLPFDPRILLAVSAGSITTLDAEISHKTKAHDDCGMLITFDMSSHCLEEIYGNPKRINATLAAHFLLQLSFTDKARFFLLLETFFEADAQRYGVSSRGSKARRDKTMKYLQRCSCFIQRHSFRNSAYNIGTFAS